MNHVLETLLAQTNQEMAAQRRLPESTYRLQFHAGFTFRDACRLTPYLRDLGITHCYASSYLKARPGSKHGYDIVDHRLLNPEIGSDQDYDAWIDALRTEGLEQILDTVPNHMGIVGNENIWWNDVLENGPCSPYAGFFDIDWYASPRPELQGKVLLPCLGDSSGKALESQQIRLEYAAGAFTICYFENRWPVSPNSYGLILGHRREDLEQQLGPEDPALAEYQSILTAVNNLRPSTDTTSAAVAERQREKEVIKRRLAKLTRESDKLRGFCEATIALFNGQAGEPRSFDLMDQLLNEQVYWLCNWRVASDEINYRRFFDINDLAALSMERDDVFAAAHELVLRWLCQGKVAGLRIDHPDGLYDPKQYLLRLQAHFILGCARGLFESRPEYHGLKWEELEAPLRERIVQALRQKEEGRRQKAEGKQGSDSPAAFCRRWPLYVVVEKILGVAEALPPDWPTDGTSGYDFLNWLNGLFVATDHVESFTRLYHDWIGDSTLFAEVAYRNKLLILQTSLSSELHTLVRQLDRLARKDRWSRDFTLHSLHHALREVIACFPVYRSYISEEGVNDSDTKQIQRAVQRARLKDPILSPAYFQFIADMLLQEYRDNSSPEDQAEQRRFAGKFQQVTAPVTAKGVEDTAFYVYNRLLSLNEVGGDPSRFGQAPAALHQFLQDRQAHWPRALSATSTHDTKRSEDVRARLNVLSEMPGQWHECLVRWSKLNALYRVPLDEGIAPDANEEYLLYQTLIGAWPLEPCCAEEYAEFVRRIQDFMRKALHEAKVHTSWINPHAEYDAAVQQFVVNVLNPETNAPFVDEVRSFQRRISHFGLLNSLAQTLVKIAAPGVPDIYQGAELWDFSLVDPDNRRPVDYELRLRLLAEIQARTAAAGAELRALTGQLLATKEDGRVKLYVTARALGCRREHPGLFSTGDYLPVEVAGPRQDQVFAFARHQGDCWALVVVPRLLVRTGLSVPDLPVGKDFWQDTTLLLSGISPEARLRNRFTGEEHHFARGQGKSQLVLAEVFAFFPVALLMGQ
jgi:(1->4)-alpha-D-glucan 1-alpha-D-glucosylmutase